ncbi:unnamed protein product [Hymenolepis diminuta]|uniref:Uncharacterized protein n=1 Tax=Hymenolepis diminuta TaxID=6216 RepID=A0A564XY32_HYMDI|nr:unnamed protein product [Hymenolepis diminuta]
MIVVEAPPTRLCLGTSPVNTVPSFSYKHPVQLKPTYNYVLTRVLIQVMNINSLSKHARHTQRLSLVRHIFLRSLLHSILPTSWESVLQFVQYILVYSILGVLLHWC